MDTHQAQLSSNEHFLILLLLIRDTAVLMVLMTLLELTNGLPHCFLLLFSMQDQAQSISYSDLLLVPG